MDQELALRNVEGWLRGIPLPPLSMELAITRRCNLRCIFCSFLDAAPPSRELSLQECLRIVEEAGEMGIPEISLAGGGEPFFEPQKALEVMRAIKAGGMNGSVTTNGLFSEATAKQIVRMKWDNVVVSLDGPDSESHDFMRNGSGLFKRTVRTLECFRDIKEEMQVGFPDVHISMILSNRTHLKVAEMFALAKRLGVTRVNILPLLDHMPSSHVARLDSRHLGEFKEHAKAAQALAEQLPMESNLSDLMDGLLVEKQMESDTIILADACREGDRNGGITSDVTRIPCYFPWTHLVVHSTGHVKPCIQEDPASFLDGRPLKEVWERDAHLNDIRASMLRGILPRMCSSCCAPVIGKNRRIREYARSNRTFL